MADLTQLDETLRRILSEPSTAARIAYGVAYVLDEHPHCTVTGFDIGYAVQAAVTTITDGLPEVVIDEALRAVAAALPHPYLAESCGEYSLRVRNAARGL